MSLPTLTPAYWYQRNTAGLVVTASETVLNVSPAESAGWLFPAIDAAALSQVNLIHLWLAADTFSARNVRLRLVGSPLANAAQWDATLTSPVTESSIGSPEAPPGTNLRIDVTDAFRAAWNAAGRGAIPGLEIRVSDGDAFAGTVQLATLQYVLGRAFYSSNASVVFGAKTVQQTRTIVKSTGTVSIGAATRSQTRIATSGQTVVGGSTKQGLIYATKGLTAVRGDVNLQVYWRTNGGVGFGGATRSSNRFLVPLRLKAARVQRDVGYMWIPVYLQLPVDDVSDRPWEFFYPGGQKIPHLIRNTVGHQVRALVYMRPSVTQAQDFFCRVG